MRSSGRCKAELLHDAPFVVAMGACVLNSLVFPLPVSPHDNEDGESVIDSADARFAVMGIISFIPYFNWMLCAFELHGFCCSNMLICCAHRSKLSLSPEESWLPIASILLCILHIQLEASIKNGDLQEFQLFKKSPKKDARNISEQLTTQETFERVTPEIINLLLLLEFTKRNKNGRRKEPKNESNRNTNLVRSKRRRKLLGNNNSIPCDTLLGYVGVIRVLSLGYRFLCLLHKNSINFYKFVAASIKKDMIACDVVNPDDIDVEFDSIGGLDSTKQALYELAILPLRRPELFASGRLLSPQKGVLLYGPPGTGKTMLAKAIAKESGAVFINVRVSNLMSKWFGDAQKLAIFSLAHKLQPAIIFIDEVDSFLGQRRSSDNDALTNMKTEFMALWDGFTTDKNARVMVLAATNRPSDLDEAILRRLPQAFEIGKPGQAERAKILKVTLKGEQIDENIDFYHIASLCGGFTGSDIVELCKQAAYFPLKEYLQDEKEGKLALAPRPMSQMDLEKAVAATRNAKIPRVDPDDNQKLDSKAVASQILQLIAKVPTIAEMTAALTDSSFSLYLFLILLSASVSEILNGNPQLCYLQSLTLVGPSPSVGFGPLKFKVYQAL
ncbi:ATPase, AAA-type, core, P-loop containing nucleoside triphosphate hydrolase [Artemisia annua]|uniref:ATPase, AAA-type, core, P-loop containing nucleoside triphosphate hydrolase n=1 Tax=Artemisia annua TaxID=35608 RepID=A0A2U1PD04_ARTAN|nr:ATPase, AAA-type, core, P-loop containing nucleoside triphosphate hydrolase [Artemisia annua]